MTTVLVVEDDAPLRRALRTSLRARGLDVVETANGEEALVRRRRRTARMSVLLDLGLPGLDGIDVLRRMRSFSDVPVVVLTARDRQTDKVGALDAGADDYVTKPFDTEELLARLRAVLRRVASPSTAPAVTRVDNLEIDLVHRQVRLDGKPVHLTKTELAAARAPGGATRASCSPTSTSCARCGDPDTGGRATTCASTSVSCGASSTTTPPTRA